MEQVQSIASNKDVLDFIIGSLSSNEYPFIPIFDDNINLIIKLEGEQWSGGINYQIANFIIKLQDEIININNEIFKTKSNVRSLKTYNKKLVINVRVEPGCTQIIAKFSDILNLLGDGIKNMESKDIKQTVIALAIIWGLTSAGSEFISYLKQSDIHNLVEQQDQVTREAVQAIKSVSASSLEHMHYLAKEMDANDKMTLGKSTYTKIEALEKFPKDFSIENEAQGKTYFIDGRYSVAILDFEKWSVRLVKEGKRFPIETKFMSEKDKETLHEIYLQADKDQIVPMVDIQVSAEILEGKILSAVAVSLGEPRPASIPLKTALQQSITSTKSVGPTQGSLLD